MMAHSGRGFAIPEGPSSPFDLSPSDCILRSNSQSICSPGSTQFDDMPKGTCKQQHDESACMLSSGKSWAQGLGVANVGKRSTQQVNALDCQGGLEQRIPRKKKFRCATSLELGIATNGKPKPSMCRGPTRMSFSGKSVTGALDLECEQCPDLEACIPRMKKFHSSASSELLTSSSNCERPMNGGSVGMVSSGEFSRGGVGPLSINNAKKLTVAKWKKTRSDHARKTYNKKGNLHKSLEPRCIRVSGPFGRTLPGELARSKIGAGLDCPRVVCHEVPGWVETDIETSPTCTTEGQKGATTRKSRRADRMAAWENKESIAGLLRDHPSRSFATHAQVAGVIAKSLPLHTVATFLKEFNSFVPPPPKKGLKPKTLAPIVQYREKIMKTPVDWITSALERTFGSQHVSVTKCHSAAHIYDTSGGRSKSDLDIVVMDCVLARTIRIRRARRRKTAILLDTPVKMYTYVDLHHKALRGKAIPAGPTDASVGMGSADKNREQNCLGLSPMKLPDDNFYRACVVVIPEAGVFYCHRERRKESAGVQNSHIPMDINWLRLRYNTKSTVDN